ncbi:MAG: sulfurtransferase TusA family protein [Candidatus Heimdallarchaeota archaeon]|nr:MAG: sulfurtransferase TusA family protein [Candidatus Heimdallarchaeota archaeon]
MMDNEADILVDITGLTCPIPLIKARRAIKSATKGQTIKFVGTSAEEISRKEILIAVSNLKQPLLENKENLGGKNWHILIQKD